MSFGAELKDFASAFSAGYSIGADRRDKKWMRERQALNDPIDREYKQAATEGMRKRNHWYDRIADIQTRTGEKNLEWYDRKSQAAIDESDARIYGNFLRPRGGKPGETLTGDAPEGEPEASGAPVGGAVGDHASSPDVTSDADTDSDVDTSGEDTGGDEDATVDPAAYRPAGSSGEVYNRFMRTVYNSGVKNPNGLAAIAATANRESRFSPRRAYGRWADPSESGQQGVSGGIMSWRDNRYVGLQHFARARGDDPSRPSPETQAMYLFHENPRLKDQLNSARSPGEAQQIMNNAWAFAGYDRDSPERRARMSLADKYASDYGQFLATGGVVRPTTLPANATPPVNVGGRTAEGSYYSEANIQRPTTLPQNMAIPVGLVRRHAEGSYYSDMRRPRPTVMAAVGGVVPAIGNDEEDQNAPVPTQQVAQALPVQAPVPTERPVDQPAPDAGTSGGNPDVGYDPSLASNPKVVGFTKAHEAVLDGIRYSLTQMGIDRSAAIQDPDRAAKMAEYLKGAGAAPKKIIDQAYDAVDPKHELPDSERTMAALGMVYDHYVRQGDPTKAKAAAASIVQYQRKMFQQYSAIAKAAIADGNIDAATKAAVKAYSSVPDGQDMKVKKLEDGRYQIEITDEATGKTISKPVLTPQEIGGWAMKVNPGSFDQFIMDAAGVRKQGGGPPSEDFQKLAAGIDDGTMPTNKDMAALPLSEQKELRQRVAAWQKANPSGSGAKPATFTETNKMRETINGVFDQMASETRTDENGNEVPVIMGMDKLSAFDRKTVVHAAADIVASPHNRSPDYNVSEEDAITAGLAVSKSMDYKVEDKDGGKLVTLPDNRAVWMPKAHFNQLTNVYKRTVADAKKKIDDADAAAKDAATKSKASNERAGKYEKNNPAYMAIPGTSGGNAPVSDWGLPLGAPQSAIDDLDKIMGR